MTQDSLIRVTAAILVQDGRVLLAQRRATDRLAGKWEFPGGKIEPGETPEACLAREMREEFRVEIAVGPLFGVSRWESGRGQIELLAYRCNGQSGDFVPVVHAAFAWVPVSTLTGYDLAPADVPLAQQLRAEWSQQNDAERSQQPARPE